MTPNERQSVFSLAFLYATRMLGLFMVLPVFMLHGQDYEQANEVLLGVALGAYGLSQALFQIPFGSLSDRFGRKRLIFIGLMLFLLGSVIAALSTNIYGVIAGRFLQGAGAIASVLMALLSDLTSEASRTKAMATVGISIGISFSVALVIGPLIAEPFGLEGIFWVTAALAVVGIGWLVIFVPAPVQITRHRDTRIFRDQLAGVLRNPDLLHLDWGIFALHLSLTAMFIAVPISLTNQADIPEASHWWIYLSVTVLSFIAMIPFIILGEKKRLMKQVFIFAILMLSIAAFSLIWSQAAPLSAWFSLFFFFMAFNLLEASLPSMVSKTAPAGGKGTAMGVYSTSQFMGAFIGGVMGGWILSSYAVQGVYLLVAGLCLLWALMALFMRNPNPETGLTLAFADKVSEDDAEGVSRLLLEVAGVEEVVVIPEDHHVYLKVIKSELDQDALEHIRLGYVR